MSTPLQSAEKLSTIIDNQSQNTVLEALKRILPEAQSLDVATGYFEIGSLLALDSFWNQLKKIRLIMGDEMTKRTRRELVNSLRKASAESIEHEKEKDDSLTGLTAIRQALEEKRILARVYTRAKFHAKTMLLEMLPPHLSNYGIVGSSNFTEPGLRQNVELNLLTTDQLQLQALQSWFDVRWEEGENIKDELLQVIAPHLREYAPFEIYCKALDEYFRMTGTDQPKDEWEKNHSKIFPLLSAYQIEGYNEALNMARRWHGALICDGVGLGKTFIGLMLIERLLREGKRILLVVPKSTRDSVWERKLERYLEINANHTAYGTQLEIHSHTDFGREGKLPHKKFLSLCERTDIVIIDEAHHFRKHATKRGKLLMDLMQHPTDRGEKKSLFLLTATPINNTLHDLRRLIEYFANEDKHFASLGIQGKLVAYFNQLEKRLFDDGTLRDETQLQLDLDDKAARELLSGDRLLKHVLIQRSRAYAIQTEKQTSQQLVFPLRSDPKLIRYSIRGIYGKIFDQTVQAFTANAVPHLRLAIYTPEAFRRGDQNKTVRNSEDQLLGLLRTIFIKRLESSYRAFEGSCEDLLQKFCLFLRTHAQNIWEEWKQPHADLLQTIVVHHQRRFPESAEYMRMPEDWLDAIEEIEEDELWDIDEPQVTPESHRLDEMIRLTKQDADILAEIIYGLACAVSEARDDKLKKLIDLLQQDDFLRKEKVVIFSEFRDTARYLYEQLSRKFPQDAIAEVDSQTKNRETVIQRFAPVYNELSAAEQEQAKKSPIRILIATDVLSEGLNLQDARLLINYDLHWNPVRLMQRIGRVDRRLDKTKEAVLGRNENTVHFWNALLTDELGTLFRLYERLKNKLWLISETLGIEGGKLLTPDDYYKGLRDFVGGLDNPENESPEEKIRAKWRELKNKFPDLFEQLAASPKRLFSGKLRSPSHPAGLFACYRIPNGENNFSVEWFFRTEKKQILRGVEAIDALIECTPETPRLTAISVAERRKLLKEIEADIRANEARARQLTMEQLAGKDAKQKINLLCWMEIVGTT